ncbi:MAG: ferrous iron transport protein A [Synergistaceae bacterium]|jgi:ferrous iron transport protein A|nr:ferrous iron transport protein A [Synergistaceae bacterium]
MSPLISAPIGSEVTVAKIAADDKVKRRLEDLGVLAGQPVTPIASLLGNTVLRVKESRLVINHGLAERIYVN